MGALQGPTIVSKHEGLSTWIFEDRKVESTEADRKLKSHRVEHIDWAEFA
jgi:hypothetical protein